ncbi:hypothetical protein N658DRAFT_7561, partial [Parathielavia hyrcaniae]
LCSQSAPLHQPPTAADIIWKLRAGPSDGTAALDRHGPSSTISPQPTQRRIRRKRPALPRRGSDIPHPCGLLPGGLKPINLPANHATTTSTTPISITVPIAAVRMIRIPIRSTCTATLDILLQRQPTLENAEPAPRRAAAIHRRRPPPKTVQRPNNPPTHTRTKDRCSPLTVLLLLLLLHGPPPFLHHPDFQPRLASPAIVVFVLAVKAVVLVVVVVLIVVLPLLLLAALVAATALDQPAGAALPAVAVGGVDGQAEAANCAGDEEGDEGDSGVGDGEGGWFGGWGNGVGDGLAVSFHGGLVWVCMCVWVHIRVVGCLDGSGFF